MRKFAIIVMACFLAAPSWAQSDSKLADVYVQGFLDSCMAAKNIADVAVIANKKQWGQTPDEKLKDLQISGKRHGWAILVNDKPTFELQTIDKKSGICSFYSENLPATKVLEALKNRTNGSAYKDKKREIENAKLWEWEYSHNGEIKTLVLRTGKAGTYLFKIY